MAESQNIEYKESWRDEYLKWLCGFANAQGGTIYIGIDDAGNKGHVSQIADFRSGGDIQRPAIHGFHNAVTQQHCAVVQSAQRGCQSFPAPGRAFFRQGINGPGPEGHGIRQIHALLVLWQVRVRRDRPSRNNAICFFMRRECPGRKTLACLLRRILSKT